MILLDTHVLVWFVQGDPRLGKRAALQIAESFDADAALISAITPWELAMLSDKARVDFGTPTSPWVDRVLEADCWGEGDKTDPAVSAGHLPRMIHGDPADRILIATALHEHARLITAGPLMLGYAEQGHLQAIDARD